MLCKISSNRTYMELKHPDMILLILSMTSSNRTYMELKLGMQPHLFARLNVLIVPLWNWNIFTKNIDDYSIGSNRTFMELTVLAPSTAWVAAVALTVR